MSTLELPILDDDGEMCSTLAPIITLGIMCFPQDPDAPDAFATAKVAEALFECIAMVSEVRLAVDEAGWFRQRFLWDLHGKSKTADSFDTAKASQRGLVAGRFLNVALRLGMHLPRFASVNNVARILMLESGKSRSEIMKIWGEFKCVSHLWAAMLAFAEYAERGRENLVDTAVKDMEQKLPAGITREEALSLAADLLERDHSELFSPFHDDNFAAFLSMAEGLRLQAERQQARGARETLIAAGTAHSAPLALKIPPATFDLPPPAEWMVKEIGSI